MPSVSEACEASEFTCGDGTCIDAKLLCNKASDCPDGADEQWCPSK